MVSNHPFNWVRYRKIGENKIIKNIKIAEDTGDGKTAEDLKRRLLTLKKRIQDMKNG